MTPEQLKILNKLRQLEFFIKDGNYGVRIYSIWPARLHSWESDSIEAVLAHAQTLVAECGGRSSKFVGANEFVTEHLAEGSACIVEFLCVPELCEKFLLEKGEAVTSFTELHKRI